MGEACWWSPSRCTQDAPPSAPHQSDQSRVETTGPGLCQEGVQDDAKREPAQKRKCSQCGGLLVEVMGDLASVLVAMREYGDKPYDDNQLEQLLPKRDVSWQSVQYRGPLL